MLGLMVKKGEFGFRKGTGCSKAIASIMDFVYGKLDDAKPVIATF